LLNLFYLTSKLRVNDNFSITGSMGALSAGPCWLRSVCPKLIFMLIDSLAYHFNILHTVAGPSAEWSPALKCKLKSYLLRSAFIQ